MNWKGKDISFIEWVRRSLTWASLDEVVEHKPLAWYKRVFRWLGI